MDQFLQFDPAFYWVAVPGVLLTGLSKGGFGGGLAMLGTPMLAIVISPVQAAAIMLPVLLLMDAIGLWSYRGRVNWQVILDTVPAAFVGIFIGWWTAAQVSDDWIRLIVGMIAVVFAVNQATKDLLKRAASGRNRTSAAFWGTFAGFTSFIAHAGGPPYQAYTLPLKMEKLLFAGTGVVFFAIINSAKVLPYFALGQFDTTNLTASLTLMPLAVIGVLVGVWAVKKVSQRFFYNLTYIAMIVVGAKLLWDGRAALGL